MRRTLPARIALALAVLIWTHLPAGTAAANDNPCAEGEEFTAGLCYTKCKSGYKAAATMCVPGCPAGFRDDGLHCAKPAAYGRGAGYPWKFGDKAFSLDGARARCARANPQGCEKVGEIIYPLCREGFRPIGSNICSPTCPSGFTDIGVSCQKQTYDRGAGKIPKSVGGSCKVDYASRLPNGTPRRYDQMTWLTAHNAFATSDDGWVHAMQTFNIAKQLAGGVRALMLDVYEYEGKVVLCHGSCTGALGSNYVSPRKTLGEELKAVKAFLDANRTEIVTLIFESYVGNAARIDAEIASAGLSAMVYDPDDDRDRKVKDLEGRWPTIDWMVERNRRLVVLSQNAGDVNASIGAARQMDYTVENTYNLGEFGQDMSCTKRGSSDDLKTPGRMFVMNHFRSLPNLVAAQQDNTKDKIVSRFKTQCQSQTVNPPSFLAVDFYHHPNCGPAAAVNEFNTMWR